MGKIRQLDEDVYKKILSFAIEYVEQSKLEDLSGNWEYHLFEYIIDAFEKREYSLEQRLLQRFGQAEKAGDWLNLLSQRQEDQECGQCFGSEPDESKVFIRQARSRGLFS